MFDLQSDPHELTNIYGKSQHAALQSELHAELARLRNELELPPIPRADADARQ
jgi:hypothetical protein